MSHMTLVDIKISRSGGMCVRNGSYVCEKWKWGEKLMQSGSSSLSDANG